MKKLLLLLVPALFLFSCNNDDSNTSSAEGTWKLTSFTTSEAADINNDGVETTNFMAETNCYNNSSLVLSSGNVANFLLEELDIELNLVTGTTDQYEYTVSCIPATDYFGTWTQNNNTVAVTIDDEVENFNMNGNTLSINLPEFIFIEVNQGGNIITKFVGANLVFTKQ